MADNSKKRKQTSNAAPAAKRPRFPQKPSRNIPSTPTSTAYPNGEVNVKNFLKSHENEIKSLESAMKAAKKGLARRAFQDVPRELRRRTASHNPRRVPKRLRARARQEAKEDNTPVVKGKSGSGIGKGKKKWLRKEGIEKSRQAWQRRAKRRKAKNDVNITIEPMDTDDVEMEDEASDPAISQQKKQKPKPKVKGIPSAAFPKTPPSRFRRRQLNKTWLPTHVWHTKRARMTPPKEPLWRFALPLAPVTKAYRLTHRAAAQRGAVAWDMSYMSTIGLEGVGSSIVGMLKSLHFSDESEEDPWQKRGKAAKWQNGTRAWEGWMYEPEGKAPKQIAFVTVIWTVQKSESEKRKVFVRVHPSAFLQLWNQVVEVSKVQKPAVTVEDLRFEIGSIEVMGPAAAETLCSILSPIFPFEAPAEAPQALWASLAVITDPGVLPSGALLAFQISDPRLKDPPETSQMSQDTESQAALMQTLAYWPIDTTQATPSIFSRDSRLAAGRLLPSQKSINRRKSACTLGEHPEPRSTDPQIPILTYVSKTSKSWTVLLPWKCVSPVWHGIVRYPISTGGNPRFGGLKEKRQVDFERSTPSFPFDYPGTNAGWSWELQEREARKHDWTKRPKGKRIEWSTIDLGNGRKGEIGDPWACDWERLTTELERIVPETEMEAQAEGTPFQHILSRDILELIAGRPTLVDCSSQHYLFTAKISMVSRGTPTNCARVYRLPSTNAELRDKWLSLIPKTGPAATTKHAKKKDHRPNGGQKSERNRHQKIAQSLLTPPMPKDGPPKAGDDEYPVVPDEKDLIGFVTTGNYNLAEGMPTAIANIVLHKALDGVNAGAGGKGLGHDGRVCIIREAGHTIGRLATWEAV